MMTAVVYRHTRFSERDFRRAMEGIEQAYPDEQWTRLALNDQVDAVYYLPGRWRSARRAFQYAASYVLGADLQRLLTTAGSLAGGNWQFVSVVYADGRALAGGQPYLVVEVHEEGTFTGCARVGPTTESFRWADGKPDEHHLTEGPIERGTDEPEAIGSPEQLLMAALGVGVHDLEEGLRRLNRGSRLWPRLRQPQALLDGPPGDEDAELPLPPLWGAGMERGDADDGGEDADADAPHGHSDVVFFASRAMTTEKQIQQLADDLDLWMDTRSLQSNAILAVASPPLNFPLGMMGGLQWVMFENLTGCEAYPIVHGIDPADPFGERLPTDEAAPFFPEPDCRLDLWEAYRLPPTLVAAVARLDADASARVAEKWGATVCALWIRSSGQLAGLPPLMQVLEALHPVCRRAVEQGVEVYVAEGGF